MRERTTRLTPRLTMMDDTPPFPTKIHPGILTNFSFSDRPAYEAAIAEFREKTGRDVLRIEEKAYHWNIDRFVVYEEHHALSCVVPVADAPDLGLFWRILRRIEKETTP